MTKRPCLVIGASGNIGEEIALHLAAQGRPLALVHSAKSTNSERIPPNDDNIRWYGVDVCDSREVTHLIKTIEHDFGAPPDLVYCAGIVKDGSIPLISDETWQAVIQTNLSGAFHCIRAVSRSLMVVGNGRICVFQ
ncbi:MULTISPECIES: SDR family NAD(P)-dependent oxidoreductase [unclassified Herbaspirillum]|uniref:SDR family NAD(P)-dependent oxidoreductase n=1 Tax=unclassified Herbaspirillum TaxID=2624150 RepID=UPI00114DF969|nr:MULTISPECIES: SDR family NAD(P)-dependent oxidoreductase [unclassified Herbaspirillum]MBB5393809.1 NAD(P)-dependent dehydrogenase (short-subunit alcohol dehydrogenase family) [Herbaspirillum sp. SJZ102]